MPEEGLLLCYRVGRNAMMFDYPGELSLDVQRRIWRMTRDAASWDGVTDVTGGMQNLTVFLDPSSSDDERYRRLLMEAWQRSEEPIDDSTGARVTIHVRYGGVNGPDLSEVARAHGLRESEVIERHSAGQYVVSFLGFAPGFAYLDGLDPSLHAARRAVPRTRVPPGSVGIGGELTGIYPSALPGGWNLIGRTERVLFDPREDPAALLAPGDRVRFVVVP